MRPKYHIQHVVRKDIDTKKWDASPSLIYNKSWYLDHMTDGQWDALVLEDYDAVMPLTWKRKWGIRYLYQPAFIQQLGIYASYQPSAGLIDAFVEKLTGRYRFAEIFLNYHNNHPTFQPYVNFVLDLDAPYTTLSAHYKQDLVNNLKKGRRISLQYRDNPALDESLSLFRQFYSPRLPHVRPEEYGRFKDLCHTLQQKGQLILRGVYNVRQELLATAVIPHDDKRLYLLQSTVTPAGRQDGANHFLLDRLIAEFAQKPLTLDFEGSEEPGIAHFYANFGGIDQPYFFFRHNKLRWPWSLFK